MTSRPQNFKVAWIVAALGVCFIGSFFIFKSLATQGSRDLVRVTHGDPAVQSAAREAQKRLPEFVDRLKHPKPGERFAIDGEFSSPLGSEYLWAKNPKMDAKGFSAILDQPPVVATRLHKGDTVVIPREKVYDWIIQSPDGSREGDFVARTAHGR